MDSTKFNRKFGVEFELNSFDNRDFKLNPLKTGELPLGVNYIADLLTKNTENIVEIRSWDHTHNNHQWIIKPDSSCGIEICSPVYSGIGGLSLLVKNTELLSNDFYLQSDEHCSFHVHVNVSDLEVQQLAAVLTHWLKYEAVFMDSVPLHRKNNQFCQFIGLTDKILSFNVLPAYSLVKFFQDKYYSANTYHYNNNKKLTIEFRISEATFDPFFVKNWVNLLIRFVEVSKDKPLPSIYNPQDKYSGYCWLDPIDLFEHLMFFDNLSPLYLQTRAWFLNRLKTNIGDSTLRETAKKQVDYLLDVFKDDVSNSLYEFD